ncbi:MAG: class GN sortase [Pseudomonadales bacterium]
MRCKPSPIVIALVVLACWQMGDGLWIYAKARLAQYLIADAWQQTLATGHTMKPWPWADTWPVARLQALDKKIDLYVLAGTNGSALAFGPGHMHGSAYPGTEGVSIVGGHRDTHFRFLQQLAAGDLLKITTRSGDTSAYRVVDQHIADSTVAPLQVTRDESQLLLITCYPFDALRVGGPLRYVVTAVAEQSSVSTDTVLL